MKTNTEEINILVTKTLKELNAKLNNADNYLQVVNSSTVYVCNRVGNRIRKFSNQNIEIAKEEARNYFYKTLGYIK
jgi:hypothetical protein